MKNLYRILNWNIRFKSFFFETYYYNEPVMLEEESFKFIALDFLHLEGYIPLSTLKKAHYDNYINIEIDLFWKRLLISFGVHKQVDYDLAFRKFKERQRRAN